MGTWSPALCSCSEAVFSKQGPPQTSGIPWWLDRNTNPSTHCICLEMLGEGHRKPSLSKPFSAFQLILPEKPVKARNNSSEVPGHTVSNMKLLLPGRWLSWLSVLCASMRTWFQPSALTHKSKANGAHLHFHQCRGEAGRSLKLSGLPA